MRGLDKLKHWLISVWIGLFWLGLVNICLDWLILVWIGYYHSRWVKYKKVLVNISKNRLILVKILGGLLMLTDTWTR